MTVRIARQASGLALVLVLLIAGCSESYDLTPALPAGSNLETPTFISTATLSPTPHLLAIAAAIYELTATTRAKTPSATPTSTLSPRAFLSSTPTLTATPTSTFDYSRFITNTPAPAARCPQVQEGAIVTPEFFNPESIFGPKAQDILQFLNTYGPNSLISFYQQEGKDYYKKPIEGYADYTNDGVRELAFGDGFFNIFGCQNGKYVLLYQHEADAYLLAPDIILVQDANRNGVPEIILITDRVTQGGRSYLGIEWDGSQFRKIFQYPNALGGQG